MVTLCGNCVIIVFDLLLLEKSGQFIASLLNALFTRIAIVIIQNRKRGRNIWKNFEEIMSERKNRIEARKDELIRRSLLSEEFLEMIQEK